jgi:hypothetical protein
VTIAKSAALGKPKSEKVRGGIDKVHIGLEIEPAA